MENDDMRAGASARATADALRAAAERCTDPERRRRIENIERDYRQGAAGEDRTAVALAHLEHEGWLVFHDRRLGARGPNVDHLIVGPGGIFSINTKNLSRDVWVAPRTILVGGYPRDFLPRATEEGLAVAQRLDAPVVPVIAVFCPKMTIKQMPADVAVIPGEWLVDWLQSRAPLMSRRQVLAIAAKIDDPATWA
jgi:hypothetical protein